MRTAAPLSQEHIAVLLASDRYARVHLNLFNRRFSIAYSTGRFYADELHLTDCTIVRTPRLQQRFEAAPHRRTVHLFIRGKVRALTASPINGERIRCNPFTHITFYRERDECAVTGADDIVLYRDHTMEAREITIDPLLVTRRPTALWRSAPQ